MFGGLLNDTVQSVRACGEDVEISESFTYLGSVVHATVSLARKSYGGLVWPTMLWTRSTRVYGVVDTCAEGQRSGS